MNEILNNDLGMNETGIDDLEKLISMAEKVSETVNDLHAKTSNLRLMFIVSIFVLYASVVSITFLVLKLDYLATSFSVILIAVSASLGTGSMYFIFQYFNKLNKNRRELKSEIEILHNLLNMVYEYKDHIHDEKLSFVENAILEMRLQRITYSGNW